MTASIQKRFFRYVIPNIFGMMSISAYFLADTYFISKGVGPDELTALNLVLPIYSLILGVGNMIAIGSATRFRILRAVGDEEANQYFGNALFFAILCSLPFVIVGAVFPEALVRLLGAEGSVITPSIDYSQVFLWFTPFFMCNHICAAFVRNDGAPTVAMIATITSSIFNIVMDYILMFPLGLGMTGAALATAFAPIIAMLSTSPICFQNAPPSICVMCVPLSAASFTPAVWAWQPLSATWPWASPPWSLTSSSSAWLETSGSLPTASLPTSPM